MPAQAGNCSVTARGVQPRGERCVSVTQHHFGLSLKRELNIAQLRVRPKFGEGVIKLLIFRLFV